MDIVLPISVEVNAVHGPPQGHWTLADWEQLWHEGNHYEVIDGILYLNPLPSIFHQWIIGRLYRCIGIPIHDEKLGYVGSRVAVITGSCNPVQPDFWFVSIEQRSILHDRYAWGTPNLIAEVLSPNTSDYHDYFKLTAYGKAGVPEYVVVNPSKRQLRLYQLKQIGTYAEPKVFKEQDTLTLACLPTLPLQVSKLFEGAPDETL